MKINVMNLKGKALGWAVAKCEGHQWREGDTTPQYAPQGTSCWMPWRVSADWYQAGTILFRELIGTGPRPEGAIWPEPWLAMSPNDEAVFYGETPLIAGMRCYVSSKLGGRY